MKFPAPSNPNRRTILAGSLAVAGLLALAPTPLSAVATVIANITGLYSVEVARAEAPRSTEELARLLRTWPGKVAVGGGRYSMGGQIAVKGGLHLDMRRMNAVVWVRPAERLVRVQAGVRWRDLQDVLDPVGLAVKTMQSYANFTVGGAVSVNAHGRYVGHGPVGHSVRALQLVLADGTVVETSREGHADLFHAAIGGYGAVGVIAEVELDLADNVRIERTVVEVPLGAYVDHFRSQVLADPRAILHNADLLPPEFDAPVSVTWRRVPADTPLTELAKLVPRNQVYGLEKAVILAMTEAPGGDHLRKSVVHPLLDSRPSVKWLNHEASLDVAELEPLSRALSTYVLQEYFIPENRFESFARSMARLLRARKVAALNVSVRHSPADQVSTLPWAKEAVFSFVLYYKQGTSKSAQEAVGHWTRELVQLALAHNGRYYLPYQLHATPGQFEQAYPEVSVLRQVKAQADPTAKLSNELWRKYL